MITKRIQKLFLLAAILEITHMPLELTVFGFNHQVYQDAKIVFDSIQSKLSIFAQNSDEAFIFMVGLFGLLWLGTTYISLKGRKWQLGVVAFFSLLFISEIHHLVHSVVIWEYYPGTIMGLILSVFGVILLKEVIKEFAAKGQNHLAPKDPPLAG